MNNQLPDKSVQLIIADPPYFEVKGSFDFVWKSFDEYLQDVEKWAVECKRLLADNGTLFWYGHAKKIAYAQIIFDKYFNLNIEALYNVCSAFIKNNEQGCIVNFTSIYGTVSPLPHIYNGKVKDIAYGISKAGVVILTKQLATHYPNFRINCIAPGGIFNNQDRIFVENYSKHVPLGRMMNVEEILPLIEFLCTPKNVSYITGAVFVIDGGYTIW